jgi:hypothetical protein
MQSFLLETVLIVASIVLALSGLHLVRKRYPHPVREANNEVAGFFIAVLGVVYAVLLAFVVSVVWEEFETARVTAEKEANEITDIYRLALALPDPTGGTIRSLAEQYAHAAIDQEWPAMARGETSPEILREADAMWAAATHFEAATDHDRLLQDQMLTHLGDFNDNRRLRELAARTDLPQIMWVLLIGGAVVTVVFTYFFSTPNPRAQYVMTAMYTASIAFVLVLVGLLRHPFAGSVHVTPEAFETSLETMRRLSGG